MNRVIIDLNPFEVSEGSRKEFETDDVLGLIRREMPEWPPSARLYYENVAAERDITPISEADIEAIKKLPEGTFYAVVYPGDPGTILVNLILVAILSAASYFLTPKLSTAPATPADRRVDDASPNNTLSARQNQARPNGRIPDIFGEVRSTPDLLALPYTFFVDHKEVEHAYMCIGRGTYDVPTTGVRDGDTRASSIEGVSVEVYGPNTSPNSGSPQLTIGDAINTDIYNVGKSTAVNGQVLEPTNSRRLIGDDTIRFADPNKIQRLGGALFTDHFSGMTSLTIADSTYNNNNIRNVPATVSFSGTNIINITTGPDPQNHFAIGRTIEVIGSASNDGTYTITGLNATQIAVNGSPFSAESGQTVALVTPLVSVNLNGTYTITSVTGSEIVLSSPAAVNSDWNLLDRLPLSATEYISPSLTPVFSRRIGPFTLADPDLTRVIVNVVAMNGLYKDNGNRQNRINVDLEFEMRKVDANGVEIVTWETYTGSLAGSATSRSMRAISLTLLPSATLRNAGGFYQIRGRQTSAYDYDFTGTIVDEAKWRDCFTFSPTGLSHFGDVTTVQALTRVTERALSARDRKLNMLVTRKIKRRSGAGFTSTLFAEKKFELILYHCALDPYIGRRSVGEIDLTHIDAIAADVRAYFGDDELAEFSYTFDKTGMSFEETAIAIAAPACCTPYRQGNQLRLAFERENPDSSLLFNHRNKVPKSEIRTYRFGKVKDFDGIEFSYIDPEDDAIETYYIPTDRSATAPKKIDSTGVRSHKQAYVLAWRQWNKLLYQRESVKFDALSEAELLIPNDRILVADNTRPGTMDGEVVAQSSLTLTLSQVAALDTGAAGYATFDAYAIQLQHIDGTVEAIGIKQGATTKEVLLKNAPSVALSLDLQNSVRTGYVIVKAGEARTTAFLATERDAAKDRHIYPVTAINYDERYYEEDLNFPA